MQLRCVMPSHRRVPRPHRVVSSRSSWPAAAASAPGTTSSVVCVEASAFRQAASASGHGGNAYSGPGSASQSLASPSTRQLSALRGAGWRSPWWSRIQGGGTCNCARVLNGVAKQSTAGSHASTPRWSRTAASTRCQDDSFRRTSKSSSPLGSRALDSSSAAWLISRGSHATLTWTPARISS